VIDVLASSVTIMFEYFIFNSQSLRTQGLFAGCLFQNRGFTSGRNKIFKKCIKKHLTRQTKRYKMIT
jgi:hypothetical protein